jgi:uncharacterized protein
MFDERLPVHIDPLRMAEAGRLLDGAYSVEELERLQDSLLDNSGKVVVSLAFGIDAEGIRYMKGRLQTELTLQCQRCLQAMQVPIDNEFALGLVRSNEAADMLPSHYEPLLLEDDSIFLRDIIEDELLLALPLVPKHDDDCVDVNLPADEAERKTDTGEGDRVNPFAALAALKSNGNT